MSTQQETTVAATRLVDKINFLIISVLVGLLPLFIIPSPAFAGQSKVLLYSVAGILLIVTLVISFLKEGKVALPKFWSVLSFGVLVVIMLISALVSGHAGDGLIGNLDMDTVGFGLLAFVLLYAIPLIVTSRNKMLIVIAAFFGSTTIAILYFLLRATFGAGFLSFGVFGDISTNLVGSWNDIGILAGLLFVLAVCAHEFMSASLGMKIYLRTTLAISFITLTIVNNLMVWGMVTVSMLLLFVYSFSTTLGKRKAASEAREISYRVPFLPLLTLVVCVLFVLIAARTNPYNFLGSLPKMSFFNRYNVNLVEGRPSLGSTISVGNKVLASKRIFGVGPNRFSVAWNQYKSQDVNQYPFWSTDFNLGYGIIPSSYVTLGILGVIAWLAFLVFFIGGGLRPLFRRYTDKTLQFVVVGSFIGALYLWFFALVYTPGVVVFILAIVFTSLMLAAKEHVFKNGYKAINFITDPRIAFGFVLGLVLVLIGSIVSLYWVSTVSAANVFVLKGAQDLSAGRVDLSEAEINNSLRIRPTDAAYRLLTSVGLGRAQTLLQNGSNEAANAQLKNIIQNTLSVGAAAVALDQGNYQNWVALGKIYQFITSPQADDAYTEGKKAYEEAAKRNPTSPYVTLLLAQIEQAHGDKEKAKELLIEAISKKPNYVDAYYALSDLYVAESKSQDALNTLSAAIQADPQNAVSWFQLGVLYYSIKDYKNALIAFQQAVSYNPQFANARYFGGLSLDKLGNHADAIKVFEVLKQTNPGNPEIDAIISNIKAGKPAISDSGAVTTAPTASSTKSTTKTTTKATTTKQTATSTQE